MTGTAFARDFYNLFPKASQELFSLLGSALWEHFSLTAGNARPWRGRGLGACGGESMVLRYRQCKRRGQKLASKQAFEWT